MFKKQMLLLLGLALALPAGAAYLRDIPQEVAQPDGTILHLLATGDEFYNWLHDERGFVVMRDESGTLVYAEKKAGRLVASRNVVGRSDPAVLGLERELKPDLEFMTRPEELYPNAPGLSGRLSAEAPGVPGFSAINNLVVFIRFSDQAEFGQAITTYDTPFNSTVAGASSMRNYFSATSYGQLTISSTFYPAPSGGNVVSYQDAHARSYFMPYNATTNPGGYTGGDSGTDRRNREHALLKAAVDWVNANSAVPAGLDIDSNSDGRVDNVCFVIEGSPTAWATLLWPHRWSLYSQVVNINGKRVYDYNFQLQSALGVSVLCHEMQHSLGAPDLYHYSTCSSWTGSNPVGTWDLMEYNTTVPQHSGAYMKYRYMGWIPSVPLITSSGVYTLNPLTSSSGNVYKIASPNSTQEFFVVEYRRKGASYEAAVPGSGLLVYRINSTETGNACGPPDEVYVYRPGGTTAANGTYSTAHFSAGVGRTAINDATNPSSFLADGTAGGLSISSVTSAGSTISFQVNGLCSIALPVAGSEATVCQGETIHLTATTVPGATYSWTGPDGFTSSAQNPTISNAQPAASGIYSVTAADGSCTSTAVTTATTVTADSTPPTVTQPADLVVNQTVCCGTFGGVLASDAAVAAFLAGATAVDGCVATTTQLPPKVGAVDVTPSTCFEAGDTDVTFSFRDAALHTGTAMAKVTVRMFGDLNLDFAIDAGDMVVLRAFINGVVSAGSPPFSAPLALADMSHDGGEDAGDMIVLRAFINGALTCMSPP